MESISKLNDSIENNKEIFNRIISSNGDYIPNILSDGESMILKSWLKKCIGNKKFVLLDLNCLKILFYNFSRILYDIFKPVIISVGITAGLAFLFNDNINIADTILYFTCAFITSLVYDLNLMYKRSNINRKICCNLMINIILLNNSIVNKEHLYIDKDIYKIAGYICPDSIINMSFPKDVEKMMLYNYLTIIATDTNLYKMEFLYLHLSDDDCDYILDLIKKCLFQ